MQGMKPVCRTKLAHTKNKNVILKILLLIISFLAVKKMSNGLNLYVFLKNPLFFGKNPSGFIYKKPPFSIHYKLIMYRKRLNLNITKIIF